MSSSTEDQEMHDSATETTATPAAPAAAAVAKNQRKLKELVVSPTLKVDVLETSSAANHTLRAILNPSKVDAQTELAVDLFSELIVAELLDNAKAGYDCSVLHVSDATVAAKQICGLLPKVSATDFAACFVTVPLDQNLATNCTEVGYAFTSIGWSCFGQVMSWIDTKSKRHKEKLFNSAQDSTWSLPTQFEASMQQGETRAILLFTSSPLVVEQIAVVAPATPATPAPATAESAATSSNTDAATPATATAKVIPAVPRFKVTAQAAAEGHVFSDIERMRSNKPVISGSLSILLDAISLCWIASKRVIIGGPGLTSTVHVLYDVIQEGGKIGKDDIALAFKKYKFPEDSEDVVRSFGKKAHRPELIVTNLISQTSSAADANRLFNHFKRYLAKQPDALRFFWFLPHPEDERTAVDVDWMEKRFKTNARIWSKRAKVLGEEEDGDDVFMQIIADCDNEEEDDSSSDDDDSDSSSDDDSSSSDSSSDSSSSSSDSSEDDEPAKKKRKHSHHRKSSSSSSKKDKKEKKRRSKDEKKSSSSSSKKHDKSSSSSSKKQSSRSSSSSSSSSKKHKSRKPSAALSKSAAQIGGGDAGAIASSKKRSRKGEKKASKTKSGDGTPRELSGIRRRRVIHPRVKDFFNQYAGMNFQDGDLIARTDAVKYLHKKYLESIPVDPNLKKGVVPITPELRALFKIPDDIVTYKKFDLNSFWSMYFPKLDKEPEYAAQLVADGIVLPPPNPNQVSAEGEEGESAENASAVAPAISPMEDEQEEEAAASSSDEEEEATSSN
jgi:hypothetical protein